MKLNGQLIDQFLNVKIHIGETINIGELGFVEFMNTNNIMSNDQNESVLVNSSMESVPCASDKSASRVVIGVNSKANTFHNVPEHVVQAQKDRFEY